MRSSAAGREGIRHLPVVAAVLDHRGRLVVVQRVQDHRGEDARPQRLLLLLQQTVPQVELPGHDELDQLLGVGLEVQHGADQLQALRIQQLRLVDEDDDGLPGLVLRDQKRSQMPPVGPSATAWEPASKSPGDLLQKSERGRVLARWSAAWSGCFRWLNTAPAENAAGCSSRFRRPPECRRDPAVLSTANRILASAPRMGMVWYMHVGFGEIEKTGFTTDVLYHSFRWRIKRQFRQTARRISCN